MRVQAPFLGVYYIGLEIRIWDLNVGVEGLMRGVWESQPRRRRLIAIMWLHKVPVLGVAVVQNCPYSGLDCRIYFDFLRKTLTITPSKP